MNDFGMAFKSSNYHAIKNPVFSLVEKTKELLGNETGNAKKKKDTTSKPLDTIEDSKKGNSLVFLVTFPKKLPYCCGG